MANWPFRRRKTHTPNPSPDLLAAKIETDLQHKQAVDSLAGAHRIGGELRRMRERNHFGQSLQSLYDRRTT